MSRFGRFVVVVLVVTIALIVGDLLGATILRGGVKAPDMAGRLLGSLSLAMVAVTVLGLPIGLLANRFEFAGQVPKMVLIGVIAGVVSQVFLLRYLYDFPNGNFAIGPAAFYLIVSALAGGAAGFVWSRMKHVRPV